MKNFLTTLLFLFFGFASLPAEKTILFLGAGETDEEFASDKFLKDSLVSWGYTVEYLDDNVFEQSAPQWSNYLGVFINETVSSSNVKPFGNSRDNYPVPCVCLEGWAPNPDRWGWINDVSDYKEK